jgi:hypothetical protein
MRQTKDTTSKYSSLKYARKEIGLTSKWLIVAARNKIPRGTDVNDPATAAIVAFTLERRATYYCLTL